MKNRENVLFFLKIIKKNHSFPLQANEFFCGLSIPDPGTIEPLENKLPKDLGSDGVDFTLRSDFLKSYLGRGKRYFQWA